MNKIISELLKRFSLRSKVNKWLELGNASYVKGCFAKSIKYYQKALCREAKNLPVLCNLGNACFFIKKYVDSLKIANQLISDFSNQACGYSLRGRIYLETEKYSQAIADLSQAVKLDNNDFWNHNYLSQALQKNGEYIAALDAAYMAVELSDGEDSQHLNFAYALYEIALEKDSDYIKKHLRKWQQKYADNPIVQQSINSFAPNKKFTQSLPQYVEKVFDNFADSFEETLADLEYDSPAKIAEVIQRRFSPQKRFLYDVLDLGCGTGLCGNALDSLFKKRFMVGVDLSFQMLNKARQKKLYDLLDKSDIIEFLWNAEWLFDVVVAADVFTYFGSLEKVFFGVFDVLADGGIFTFSISQNTINNQDWFLHLSGRFVHSQRYLKYTLKKCGFRDIEFVDSILRKEGGEEVKGWIVSAFK